jgi:NitT/TauT family transport system substrate-binding protein
MVKGKMAVLVSVLLLVVIAGYLWQAGYLGSKAAPPDRPLEKIAISAVSYSGAGLLLISQAKGYFRDNGLEVTLKLYPTGPPGLAELQAGQVDVAHVSDFVLVQEIFKGAKSLRCLGSIAASDVNRVMARKDRGILHPGDLKGRRIGVPQTTQAVFYLGQFLTFHNLSWREVEVVNLSPADLPEALANDRVEAVMVWEPYVAEIKKRLGDKVISWPGQTGQQYYDVLVSRDQFIRDKPEALVRLFRALHQAEAFVKENKNEALRITAQQLRVDPSVLRDEWLSGKYELSMDQSLLITMEDKARWLINNKLTDQTRLPDFLDYLSAQPLAKVDPQAVRIIIPKAGGTDVPIGAGEGRQ